jgi:hypothetical protein
VPVPKEEYEQLRLFHRTQEQKERIEETPQPQPQEAAALK